MYLLPLASDKGIKNTKQELLKLRLTDPIYKLEPDKPRTYTSVTLQLIPVLTPDYSPPRIQANMHGFFEGLVFFNPMKPKANRELQILHENEFPRLRVL